MKRKTLLAAGGGGGGIHRGTHSSSIQQEICLRQDRGTGFLFIDGIVSITLNVCIIHFDE